MLRVLCQHLSWANTLEVIVFSGETSFESSNARIVVARNERSDDLALVTTEADRTKTFEIVQTNRNAVSHATRVAITSSHLRFTPCSRES